MVEHRLSKLVITVACGKVILEYVKGLMVVHSQLYLCLLLTDVDRIYL